MKRLSKIITVLAMLLLSSCSHEQTEDIYILYTNDVASEINAENIGYAGVKAYKDTLKAEHRFVALVDAGDFFDGNVSDKSAGKDIVKLMNAAEYDVVTIGNQEFRIGIDALKQNIADSDFNYVSCNMKYEGKGFNPLRAVKPYVIKRFGGTKIAFIGATTPETLIPNKPASMAITDDNGKLLYSFYEGNEGQDLYRQIQKTVDKVRKRVDYVILVCHLGSNSVTKGFSSFDVINNTTGIDVVIDGHSHTVNTGEAVPNLDHEGVVFTSTGEKLEYLGQLVIHPDHTFTTSLIPQVYEKDPTIVEIIAEMFAD